MLQTSLEVVMTFIRQGKQINRMWREITGKKPDRKKKTISFVSPWQKKNDRVQTHAFLLNRIRMLVCNDTEIGLLVDNERLISFVRVYF